MSRAGKRRGKNKAGSDSDEEMETAMDSTASSTATSSKKTKHETSKVMNSMSSISHRTGVNKSQQEPTSSVSGSKSSQPVKKGFIPIGRLLPASVNYSYLPTDLITIIGHYCSVAKLVLLRRLSHHWSHASRLPQSWKYSQWAVSIYTSKPGTRVDPWPAFIQMSQSAPFLRGLTLPETIFKEEYYQQLSQLIYLERLVFYEPPVYVPISLTQLKHIRVSEDSGVIRFQVPQNCLTLAESPIGLVSFVFGWRFASFDCFHDVFSQLITGASKDTLISISILAKNISIRKINLNDFHFDWYRFSNLEVLNFSLVERLWPKTQYSAMAAAPKLRILTLSSYFFGEDLAPLFQQPEFNRRLEYLHLVGVPRRIGGRDEVAPIGVDYNWMHTLMNECTSLLVFRITGVQIRFRPLTRTDWIERLELLSSRHLSPEVLEMQACANSHARLLQHQLMKNKSTGGKDNPAHIEAYLNNQYEPQLQQLSLGQLFIGHPLVRSSLRVLEFDSLLKPMSEEEKQLHQLRVQFSVRFPRLLHLRFGQTYRVTIGHTTDTADDPVKVSEFQECQSWLNDLPTLLSSTSTLTSNSTQQHTATEETSMMEQRLQLMLISSATSTSSSSTTSTTTTANGATASSGTSSSSADNAVLTRGELSQFDQALLDTSPFAYVRAIKQLIGMPLLPSEFNYTRL